jgi:hypothetical protein
MNELAASFILFTILVRGDGHQHHYAESIFCLAPTRSPRGERRSG